MASVNATLAPKTANATGGTSGSALGAIHIAITHGPRQRDFLRLGVLKQLLALTDAELVVWTQATNDKTFMRECLIDPRVSVQPLHRFTPDRVQLNWLRLRRRFIRSRRLLRQAWRFERLLLHTRAYEQVLRADKPSLFVSTDPVSPQEWPISVAAAAAGVPSLGLVRSWDHLQKRLSVYPDSLGVWNTINKSEAVALERFPEADVEIIGPVQFDPYFAAETLEPRDAFLRRMGLDPTKKTILLATGGPIFRLAQVAWLEQILDATRAGAFGPDVQVLCRTHPNDMLGPFVKYLKARDVVIDMHDEYSPTLDWVIGLPGLRKQANSIAHADVVVTPASTVTLEAAVFDSPTLVIAYNDADPETVMRVLMTHTFAYHFKPLVERNLVPVAWSAAEMVSWIKRLLEDPAQFKEQRREIVRDWVVYTDGRSAQRAAEAIVRAASHCP